MSQEETERLDSFFQWRAIWDGNGIPERYSREGMWVSGKVAGYCTRKMLPIRFPEWQAKLEPGDVLSYAWEALFDNSKGFQYYGAYQSLSLFAQRTVVICQREARGVKGVISIEDLSVPDVAAPEPDPTQEMGELFVSKIKEWCPLTQDNQRFAVMYLLRCGEKMTNLAILKSLIDGSLPAQKDWGEIKKGFALPDDWNQICELFRVRGIDTINKLNYGWTNGLRRLRRWART